MRLQKRHAWGAVLVVWFVLPVLRPRGVDPVERPVGRALHWLGEVPVLNPRLLQGAPPAPELDPSTAGARDREVLRLWLDIVALREQLDQAGALGRVLGADRMAHLPDVRVARVVRARDAVAWRRSFVIDQGTRAGIREGQPVVWGGAYCGRVEVAWPGGAQVKLITDPQSRTEVFVLTTTGKRLRGWARRQGSVDGVDALGIEFVRFTAEDGEIRIGSPVVTANQDPALPADLLVGRIVEVEDPDRDGMPHLRMRPEMDAGSITEVVVLLTATESGPWR
jgi:rod shape-determining protein MreC